MRALWLWSTLALLLLVLGGCPSTPAPGEPVSLEGRYEAEEPGPIVYVAFEADGRYTLREACALSRLPGCEERGTYAVSEGRDRLILEAEGGETRSLPFAIAAPGVQPLAGRALVDEGSRLLQRQSYSLIIGGKSFLVGCRGPADCPGSICCTTVKLAGSLLCSDGEDIEYIRSQCTTSCQDSVGIGCRPNTVISCNNSSECAQRTHDDNKNCCAFPQVPGSAACVGEGLKHFATSCH